MQKFNENVFEFNIPGKWILAGEHSVLRGGEALVFPLESKYLKIIYTKNSSEFQLDITGENKNELELIIWSVLEKAFNILNIKRSQIFGNLKIESFIALGGGMGASATLCVALTEWLGLLGFVKETEKFNFARELENLFHGESSGVDVAVTLAKKALVFTRHNGFFNLEIKNKPVLYLSYSGQRGVTKDCVDKVKNIFLTDAVKAEGIDQEMKQCVLEFKKLLTNELTDINQWVCIMNNANQCFEKWGLVTDSVMQHQKVLIQHGALAVKLTGSGGGGYVLSLWQTKPAAQLPFEMIACFN